MLHLNIVTPCSRPENLQLLANSIVRSRKDLPITIDWYIVFDLSRVAYCSSGVPEVPEGISVFFSYVFEEHSKAGNAQRNYALDLIDQGYICFLDDDNLLHHNFLEMLCNVFREHVYEHVLVCNQLDSNFKLRSLGIKHCKPGEIDAAQYAIPYKFMGTRRWDTSKYEADGLFIQDIVRQYGDRTIFVEKTNSYYNAINSKILLYSSGASMLKKGDMVTVGIDYLKYLRNLPPSQPKYFSKV